MTRKPCGFIVQDGQLCYWNHAQTEYVPVDADRLHLIAQLLNKLPGPTIIEATKSLTAGC